MQEITKKVVSYCDIPSELTEKHWISEFMNGCYVPITITPKSEQSKYSDNFDIINWIIDNYSDILEGEEILIDIDY